MVTTERGDAHRHHECRRHAFAHDIPNVKTQVVAGCLQPAEVSPHARMGPGVSVDGEVRVLVALGRDVEKRALHLLREGHLPLCQPLFGDQLSRLLHE